MTKQGLPINGRKITAKDTGYSFHFINTVAASPALSMQG